MLNIMAEAAVGIMAAGMVIMAVATIIMDTMAIGAAIMAIGPITVHIITGDIIDLIIIIHIMHHTIIIPGQDHIIAIKMVKNLFY